MTRLGGKLLGMYVAWRLNRNEESRQFELLAARAGVTEDWGQILLAQK